MRSRTHSRPSSTTPCAGGGSGRGPSATRARGRRRCAARASRCDCSSAPAPARSSPQGRRRFPRSRAACATGTIATRGCATPCSCSTRSSPSGATARRPPTSTWLRDRIDPRTGTINVLYDLRGARCAPERELALEGWRGSRPVRVGNSAAGQYQQSTYGTLLHACHLYASRASGGLPDAQRATFLTSAARLAGIWHEPDAGIWEERGGHRHHTHSKMMSVLGLHCASDLARLAGLEHPLGDRLGAACRCCRGVRGAALRRPADGCLHPHGARGEPRRRRADAARHGLRPLERARTGATDDRPDPRTTRGRGIAALPLPRGRRSSRRRGLLHAVLVLARRCARALRPHRGGGGRARRRDPASATTSASSRRSSAVTAPSSATCRRR